MLNGIDQITYGVEDMSIACRFFSDWGLEQVEIDHARAIFECQDGSRVVLRPIGDEDLPPAFEDGPTVREVIWGTENDDLLNEVLDRVATTVEMQMGDDGIARCIDPNGLSVGFRVSQRRSIDAKGSPSNLYNSINRIDERGRIYERARPVKIGHIVFFTDDLATLETFYCANLGFHVSDRYPGRGVFLRCQAEGGHHTLFLLQPPTPKRGLNHVAFTVRDIHEVFGGGLHIDRCGWQTEIGPGRHPVSSAYFWYVKNPCGGLAEYYADEDYLTGRWKPREWDQKPENFAEWAITGGLDGDKRRQRVE